MKKTVYGIFAALTLCFAFAACDDSSTSSIDRGLHIQLPEQAIAGTYDGSYTINNGTTTGTAAATVTFTAGDSTYTAVFSSVCPTNNDATGTEKYPLNVTWSNDDIKFCFSTIPSDDDLSTGFLNTEDLNGICNADGTLSLKFRKSVEVSRGNIIVTYFQFSGKRTE